MLFRSARNTFEKFVARRIADEARGMRLLAKALASATPQSVLIAEYVSDLVYNSLQSTDSLFEIAAAVGADPIALGIVPAELNPIFDIRNKIIHELDINLVARQRTRTVRSQDAMIRNANRLLKLAAAFIMSVDARLRTA